jgi:hypothetical protein
MVMRTALQRWKHSKVDTLRKLLAREDNTRTRSTKTLMCGGCHNVAVREWVVHQLGGNKTAVVSYVGHENCTD